MSVFVGLKLESVREKERKFNIVYVVVFVKFVTCGVVICCRVKG
jgi:hypothetical protein